MGDRPQVQQLGQGANAHLAHDVEAVDVHGSILDVELCAIFLV
jgi:hypothetical protein